MRQPHTGEIPAFTLGQRLKQARDYAKLSQTDLATQLGISRYTVANYENGATVPERAKIIAWALICGVDLEWLQGPPDQEGEFPTRRRGFRTPGRSAPRVAGALQGIAATAGLLLGHGGAA